MHHKTSLATFALALLISLSASAESPFQRGHRIIGAERMWGIQYEVTTVGGKDDITSSGIGAPLSDRATSRLTGDWMVTSWLLLGGSIGGGSTSSKKTATNQDTSNTYVSNGAVRLGVLFNPTDRLAIILRGTLGSMSRNTDLSSFSFKESVTTVGFAPQLLFILRGNAGISVTLNADIPVAGTLEFTSGSNTSSNDWALLNVGLNVGLFFVL